MKHDLHVDGLGYRLRPIRLEDAKFIIDTRLEDKDRNQYIHEISPEIEIQQQWLENYFEREGDFYFVVENKLTDEPEGLISIYDLADNKAEWGRWVIKKGSLATAESIKLMFEVAFDILNLDEVYSRTICQNDRVVYLHDSLPKLRRAILSNFIEIDGVKYDAVEHYSTPKHYYEKIAADLERKVSLISKRNRMSST